MLVACFVLIGNSYFNVNIITQITYKSIGSISIYTDSSYRQVFTKETPKEIIDRINKECSKK